VPKGGRGESFRRGEKACESVTEVSTKSEAATTATATATPATPATAATTMMTATQWEIGAKPQLS